MEPWKLKGTERHSTVMHTCLESLRVVAILLQPFIPGAMDALLTSLLVPHHERTVLSARFGAPGRTGLRLLPTAPLFVKYHLPPEKPTSKATTGGKNGKKNSKAKKRRKPEDEPV